MCLDGQGGQVGPFDGGFRLKFIAQERFKILDPGVSSSGDCCGAIIFAVTVNNLFYFRTLDGNGAAIEFILD